MLKQCRLHLLFMSLHPQQLGAIPPETIRVAKLAFRSGNIYLKMRDKLGVFYLDNNFNSLFLQKGMIINLR